MSATRTQIYLTEPQRRRVDEIAEREGVTMAEIVRRALDAYLAEHVADPTPALARTFGAVPDAAAPDRDSWARG